MRKFTIAALSFLPPEAKPPLEMNRDIQEKFCPALAMFYVNRKPVFR